ncbi:hypothetical protein DICVIV_05629 [Dictyocaulus viviparus]|uniref:Armadillo/beta-catenin-like repeat protein n=1 Tax=Dictyocaulus viviparus TaxID=29172 RepID=A0A0D8XWU0_DICVI|nr:hypothetical protein DICVIV_05629 [Dictyocaulus viviparus]
MRRSELDGCGEEQVPLSSNSYELYKEDFIIDVDRTISALLASLNLEEARHHKTSEEDDELLRVTHQRIHSVIIRDQDDAKRRRLRKALPPSNCIREQIFYLRRLPSGSVPAPSYYPRLFSALNCIVKESFDEEYRKVAIILGMVDCLAELLVLELAVFKFPTRNEHRSLRKLIANALTNLTYGHAASKRRLCFYSAFIPTVVLIINEAKNLVQVYAGLVRNLSWMADGKMSEALSPTAKALSHAAVIAHNERDEGCVRSILSALWNLASHSDRNKRAICDEPGFLAVLASLLSNDARMTAVVESATGILKYVSQYLLSNPSHISSRAELAIHLVQLLSSASFTIVANTLGALGNLMAKDPQLQSLIRHDALAMNQLNVLRNSAREDIRLAVRNVLNNLNQPLNYACFTDLPSSVGGGTVMSPRDSRFLTLRRIGMSPGGVGGRFASSFSSSVEHRSSSLPRHFTRGKFSYAPPPVGIHPSPTSSGAVGFAFPPNQNRHHYIEEPFMAPNELTGNPDLEDSVRCTRSASIASLGSELPNTSVGWHSCLNTATNSNRMSPVSPSDLPDSPTQCVNITSECDASAPLSVTIRGNIECPFAGEPRSAPTASDATTVIVDDQRTPTFPAFILHQQPQSVNFLTDEVRPGCENGADLLARSIEAVLPQPFALSITPKQQRRLADDRLLADMIDSVQPTSRKSRHVDGDRLLNACINAAMPQSPSSSRDNQRTEKGKRGHTPVSQCARASQSQTIYCFTSKKADSRPENSQELKDQNCVSRNSSGSWSDNENENVGQPDTTFPLDCFIDEDITIDCSAISFPAPAMPSSAINPISKQSAQNEGKQSKCVDRAHPARLSQPANNQSSLQNFNRIKTNSTSNKQSTSAIVSPYKYEKPKSDSGVRKLSIEKKSNNSGDLGQILITMV